jgi:multimeric flavodoxin WrbA
MAGGKVIVLDGSRPGDEDLASLLAILIDELRHYGIEVQTYTLREVKLDHCIGCFGCWIETPGICVQADAGREIVQEIIRSEMTVLFTPVTFGGYSSELKKVVDRWIPLLLPDFGNYYESFTTNLAIQGSPGSWLSVSSAIPIGTKPGSSKQSLEEMRSIFMPQAMLQKLLRARTTLIRFEVVLRHSFRGSTHCPWVKP